MPTYMVFSAPGALTAEQEQRVAEAITAAHSKSTGAPRYYVQVILGAGEDIRAGRSDEQLKDLLLELMRGVARAAEIDEEDVWIDLNEVRPTAILKFRTVFPPAGREKEWEESLPAPLREKLGITP